MTGSLADTTWDEFENVIRRFESAWGAGERPMLDAYLPKELPLRLLVEMVHVDMEFRIRADEDVNIEEYVRRFPALDESPVLLDLIASEFRLRARRQRPVSHEEYYQRFPQLRQELAKLLSSKNTQSRITVVVQGRAAGRPLIPGYAIGSELGRGGMGAVYRALQPALNRTVAIKTFAEIPSPEASLRFHREAEAIARFDHPNIVPVYDVGAWNFDGQAIPFFVMKWYPGGSLDEIRCGPGTDLSAHALVIEAVARAVQHAHDRGVLHRDLKPSNILLDDRGEPCVADFGLAGWYDASNPRPLTEVVVGTPSYMPPEQARNPAGVTTAADVYGLGAIFYQLLTGKPPFQGETAIATLNLAETQPPESPSMINPEVPRDLATICLKCLEKEPSHRYRSAEAVADDLQRWRTGVTIHARSATHIERIWRLTKRHPLVTGLAIATAATLLTLVVTLFVSNARIREETQVANEALHRANSANVDLNAALERELQALYLERVASAGRLMQLNHLEPAWHTLDACPEKQRNWEWHYLDRQRRSPAALVINQKIVATHAVFLPDGRVATTDTSQFVRTWDPKEKKPYHGLIHRGVRLRVHRGENLLVIAGGKVAVVWDVPKNAVRHHFELNGWTEFSPDETILAAAKGDTLMLLDVKSWKVLAQMRGPQRYMDVGVFSQDGSTIFTGSVNDRSVVAWDLKNKTVAGEWKRPLPVIGLRMTNDGKTLLESMPSRIAYSDPATGQTTFSTDFPYNRSFVIPLPNSDLFVTTDASGEVYLRGFTNQNKVRVFRGHVGVVYSIAVSHDGKKILTTGEDGTVRIWDAWRTPEFMDFPVEKSLRGKLSLSHDGKQIAAVAAAQGKAVDGSISVMDATTGALRYSVPGVNDVAFNTSGKFLAAGRADGSIVLHDPANGAEVRRLPGSTFPPLWFVIRPDGKELVAAYSTGPVAWDTETGKKQKFVINHKSYMSALGWSPDAKEMAMAFGNQIDIQDAQTKETKRQFKVEHVPNACAFSPDGSILAFAGRHRSVEWYDAASGALLRSAIGNPSSVNALAFHPNGTRLATAGSDGFVRIWDLQTGKELLTLPGGGNDVFSVAWSPDGQRLYSYGSVLRTWDAGTEIRP